MVENSAIEWCDHTFNPWEGCQKVGPGCDHCYAEARNARFGGGVAGNWGPGAPRRRTSAANWLKPLAWQRNAAAFFAKHGRRQRVFCASLADVFDNAVDPDWRADLFAVVRLFPDLDWLFVTKRISNAARMAEEAGGWPANVWLGATVVNQVETDRDVPKLLATAGPRVRFLSMEPLLGPVDLGHWLYASFHEPRLDWIIVGGESGPGARPMHPDWARSLRDQCAAAGVPFLFKQWGEWRPSRDGNIFDTGKGRAQRTPAFLLGEDGTVHCFMRHPHDRAPVVVRVGKKAAGRALDGVTHDGFPNAEATR